MYQRCSPAGVCRRTSASSALLYRLAFDLDWQPHPWLLLLPVLGALLVGAAGLLGTRRALTASPLLILRES